MKNLTNKLVINKVTTRSPNLAVKFTEDDLQTIGNYCKEGFEQDKSSRSKWEARMIAAMDLAMQVVKIKNFPWENCSNVAFPIVTMAALQFHSRAYPAIIQGTDIVKYRVIGPDPTGEKLQKAERIGQHMSYQLLEEDEAWEEQHDRLLINLPIVGCAFKKTYYSAIKGHNISELVLAQDLVLNYHAKSVEDCMRKTHVLPMTRNQIYEKVQAGLFKDVLSDAWYQQVSTMSPDKVKIAEADRAGFIAQHNDDICPFLFLEQHCWLDLDGDGYCEPYIVTLEKETGIVVRITARWEDMEAVKKLPNGQIIQIVPTEYFTKYSFIPAPDGSVYDVGFGVLLGPLNESVNSILNQLVDAGTMANAAGGFLGRGAKMRGGVYTIAPFEWKRVDSTGDDLRKSIFPLPTRDPSAVLFNLLGFLVDYVSRVAGTTETMTGESPGQNTPATTTQATLEQGLKIFKAIFKRVYRAMKGEFKKLYILNALNLPPESFYYSQTGLASRSDYTGNPSAVAPVADPNVTSDLMRIQQISAVATRAASVPGYNMVEVEKRFLKAMHVDSWETLYTGQPAQGQDTKLTIAQMKLQADMQRLDFEKMKFAATMQEEIKLNQAKILELTAKATLEMEQAGGVHTGQQIAAFAASVGAIKTRNEHLMRTVELLLKKEEQDVQNTDIRRLPDLAATSSYPGSETTSL